MALSAPTAHPASLAFFVRKFIAPLGLGLRRSRTLGLTSGALWRLGQFRANRWCRATSTARPPRPPRRRPRTLWPGFFAQLGTITKDIHAVRGSRFGPVAGPGYATWSEAVLASLSAIADDVSRAGLDAADEREVADLAAENHKVLDEITEPRLLTGDLWTVNTMLADAPTPVISGVLDLDRNLWGDPAADWTIRMASAKTDERTAF
ncbi:phosphotransferase [Streptomyces sp. NPDC048404]|uniref:phosphotransferase n=1 Tax=unclassified Streptomyces TaxID=2593676 RepID=UPI003440EB67